MKSNFHCNIIYISKELEIIVHPKLGDCFIIMVQSII